LKHALRAAPDPIVGHGTEATFRIAPALERLRRFRETILEPVAFFVARILTSTGLVREEAFLWLLVGLPACVLLGRLWWRKYR